DGEVGLQVEQRREGAAYERLVVGQQQPDGRTAHAGTSTRTENPAPDAAGPVARVAPAFRVRSPSPARPRPCEDVVSIPTPSSSIVTEHGVSVTVQLPAALCRTTLVTASRIVQANNSRHRLGTSSATI